MKSTFRNPHSAIRIPVLLLLLCGCRAELPQGTVITFPGSAVGAEAEVLERQLARFMKEHPEIEVVQRRTPDSADQRHQLYVQWLNAGADDPDILQLDVIWTPEFAAAGWVLALDRFQPDTQDFFPATIAANRWRGELYALPWFVDVGMLYWRSDVIAAAPRTMQQLEEQARAVLGRGGLEYGLVWQGARYEGLVTVFVEYLGAYGGRILDSSGRVVVDSPAGVNALRAMQAQIESGTVPRIAVTWHEEETRFAFQNGRAVFMRNWPYAYPLMQNDEGSAVAGRFGVAPMPAAAGGVPTATLGGSQLAINANSDAPKAAYAVLRYLTQPAQMLERARHTGQYPPRRSLYEGEELATAIAVEPRRARHIIENAVPRPVTPVYTQMSELLQVSLHRALIGEQSPAQALKEAAAKMRRLLRRTGLATHEARREGEAP